MIKVILDAQRPYAKYQRCTNGISTKISARVYTYIACLDDTVRRNLTWLVLVLRRKEISNM